MRNLHSFLALLAFILIMPFTLLAQDPLYTEGFENGLPDSWQSVLCETANNTVQTASSNVHGGTKSLKISQTGTTAANYLVMPQLTGLNATGLELNFWAKPTLATPNVGTLEIGYMTDVTDGNSFVPVDTFTYDQFVENGYTLVYRANTVFLTNMPVGGGKNRIQTHSCKFNQ